MTDQVGPDLQELGSGLEHDVGGDLGLVEHPVVAAIAGGSDGGQDRIEHPGERVEHPGPGLVGEPLAQLGGRLEVVDGQERVLPADVADAGPVELAGQPLPSIDVDLALIRDPPLDPHVHEPELGIDQVEVVMEALAFPAGQLETTGVVTLADLEAEAGLDRADQTDDPLGDPVGFGDRLGQVVLVLSAVAGLHVIEGDHRSPRLGHQPAGVGGDPLRRRLRVGGEVLERHTLGPQKAARPILLVERGEMAFEDHPVEHRQAARDPIPVEILERAHGHLPTRRRHRPESVTPPRPLVSGGHPQPT